MQKHSKLVLLSAATAALFALTGCDDNKSSGGDSSSSSSVSSSVSSTTSSVSSVSSSSSSSVSSSVSSVSSSSSSSVSSSSSSIAYLPNEGNVSAIIDLAEGLSAEFFTRNAAHHVDMGAFYPYGSEAPTHMIFCVESSTEDLENGKKNPSLQAYDLSDGSVATILRGMSRCDGARVTPWGTVLATEESGATGGAYEILHPLETTEMTIVDRDTGSIVDSEGKAATTVVKRPALPSMSWEGLDITYSGVVIGGDELRPGTADADVDGGAIFKFVPETPREADAGDITALSESPFTAGRTYAMRTTCRDGGRQWGQGCEVGVASWIEVNQFYAREDADENGATGYYRPEDLHFDPTYVDAENPDAVRFCWANTGNEGAQIYGEVICGIDNDPLNITDPDVTSVNRFVEGDLDFTSVDNLAFQDSTGHLYAIEDHSNGDIWACARDGEDRDIKTDGCIRLLSVKDTSAEPTGFLFTPDGATAYVFIQHSNDSGIDLVDGYGTDDIIKITGFGTVAADADFGKTKEDELYANSATYFGFTGAKKESFDGDIDRNTTTTPDQVIDLATGLTAEFFTRDAAHHVDMGAFYPYGSMTPTHMIMCIESSTEDLSNGKKNPSLQAFDLSDGNVTTILRGMSRCDGARVTPWGTVLATEEAGATGAAYEILNPLSTTEMTITDRDAGTIVDSDGNEVTDKIIKRTALPSMSWEGLEILESGIVIGGDELRPGTAANDDDGGAIFKFVPATPRTATTDIASLDESPFVAGSVYAMRTTCRDGGRQWGQGCEVGVATWIEVNATSARADANTNGATGYYRPEDLHLDPTYEGDGIRFCWANTGNEGAKIYSEVVCGVDTDPLNITDPDVTSVNRFVEGDLDFTSADNLAFQPSTGHLYVIEDHSNGDIWACLRDGADRDIKTDGCIRLLSVKDTSAEPTGFMFTPDGTEAYVFIQHSNDSGIELVDGYGTDDIIKITGFTAVAADADFGKTKEDDLYSNSATYFGFTGAKTESFDGDVDRNTTF